MTPQSKEFLDWLQLQAKTEGDSSREYEKATLPSITTHPISGERCFLVPVDKYKNAARDNQHYRAGASNAFLEVIDYVERHPYVLANPPQVH